MIEATIICDSISQQGKRLTTFKLRYPKFIHSEFMTHRLISRNASSSRAIPTSKLIEEVRSEARRASPVFWGKNQPGMQAAEEATGDQLEAMQACWKDAALAAADWAKGMSLVGAHKQIVNRLLEPFSHINVVASATEWDNFFGLRLHSDAQPEMRALAWAMHVEMKESQPKLLKPGEWHLPFGPALLAEDMDSGISGLSPIDVAIRVSVARCARVSYESFETGKRSSIEEDLKLFDRLLGAQPLHASPAEHQATPDEWLNPRAMVPQWMSPSEHGNFIGWRQFRKQLPGESIASLPSGLD